MSAGVVRTQCETQRIYALKRETIRKHVGATLDTIDNLVTRLQT